MRVPVLAPTLLFPSVMAVTLTNLTVDDTDLNYFWWSDAVANTPAWTAITPETPCNFCSAQPQPKSIHNRTWHDGTQGGVGQLTFIGTAAWIYGIDLANGGNISFSVSGVNKTDSHYYNGDEQFVFNSLLFSVTDLPTDPDGNPRNHTISWLVEKSSRNGTTALFDYAVIRVAAQMPSNSSSSTTPDSGHSKPNAGAIAGGVIGGLFGVLLAILALFFCRRRQQALTRDMPSKEDVRPYVDEPSELGAPSVSLAARTRPLSTPTQGSSTFAGSSFLSAATIGKSALPGTVGRTKMFDTSSTSPSESLPSTFVASASTSTSANVTPSTPTAPPSALSFLISPTDEGDHERRTIAPTVVSAREQFLEQRLAVLEEHVRELNSAQPPPAYENQSSPSSA
ncbi:hypothetical protein MIND_00638000 [Mycena indigotica]|uniref:Epidermal growth factor receptor-like transmembrane-juxtamembrane segment domain-containing protein n=1 Tax=Mycena indigotica TaxID=2126181 RepID=A0A8H6SS56_9AGAR|nr:uncharacterized protein MIND_00638000 [Mycena indigotica]KAF7304065.1 hypothetical protein MIND_00638000 [Mycena indigotica]